MFESLAPFAVGVMVGFNLCLWLLLIPRIKAQRARELDMIATIGSLLNRLRPENQEAEVMGRLLKSLDKTRVPDL